MMGISEVINGKRDAVLQVAARHGASNVRVFGSVARGDATSESDVDLLVDAGPSCSPWFPGSLIADLEDPLGRSVEVATPGSVHWYIRQRVLDEAVPL